MRIAVFIGLFLGAGVVCAADNGRTAAPVLGRLSGARASALGGAFTAADGDLDGAQYNPASLAAIVDPKLQSTFRRGLAEDSLGTLETAVPLPFGVLYGYGGYYDAGTIDVNLSNGVTGSRHVQQDMVGGLGLAVGRAGNFAAGVGLKTFRLELAEEATASGAAFDAGVLYRTPLSGLVAGAAAVNMGPDVEFESEADPLPTAGRAGLCYALDISRFTRYREVPYIVSFFADVIAEKRAPTAGRGGVELTRRILTMGKAGAVSLRGGYRSAPQGIDAGLGIRLGAFGLDYALGVVQNVDNTHRITLSWLFLNDEEKADFQKRGR